MMESEKLYEISDWECIWLKPSEAKDWIGIKEVPEAEYKDISYLVEEKYVKYFTTIVDETEWTDTMERFRNKVIRASMSLNAYGKIRRARPIWRDMCERFFPQQRFVRYDEMLGHLYELNTNEVVEFLWYVVIYCVRWGEDYVELANSGIIGKLLVRLKDLPHTVCWEGDADNMKGESGYE